MTKVGYSVALRKNPMKPDEAPKAYAALQTNGTIDIAKLAKHMAQHNSKYSRADITAVMIQMVDCMREKFIEGYKIELGEMGTFSPSISCQAAEKKANQIIIEGGADGSESTEETQSANDEENENPVV